MGGSSAVQRSRFQMDGRSVITESRSDSTAWSLYDTAWSTAAITTQRIRIDQRRYFQEGTDRPKMCLSVLLHFESDRIPF